MALRHTETNQEYGITVKVFDGHDGKFKAAVSCDVTGNGLGGVEGCETLDGAIASGKKHARKFYH